MNFARNLAVDDASFAERAKSITQCYQDLCSEQLRSSETYDMEVQAAAALRQALQFSLDISRRILQAKLLEEIAGHSSEEPDKGVSDAVFVIPCSGAIALMLRHIEGRKAQVDFLKKFTLIHGKPDKQEPGSTRQPQMPSKASESQKKMEDNALLHNMFRVHPDRHRVADSPSEDAPLPDANGHDSEQEALLNASAHDLLLPVLLCEYKKKDQSTVTKAMNKMKSYLVSALRFLAALEITEQPVFGLVVNGRLGGVTMAWQKNEVCTPSVHIVTDSSRGI